MWSSWLVDIVELAGLSGLVDAAELSG
jgi:hypothetical protein